MKDEFVATVSHELRTPLTALRGHVELVLDGDGGPVTDLQRRFLDIAAQSADRLGALINDLLDVARIEAGQVQLRVSCSTWRPCFTRRSRSSSTRRSGEA